MSEANKALVRRHFEELFNRKHLAVADELVAQEYLEHAVAPFGQAEPGRVNGPAHLRQTAEWLLAQFPDLHMTIEAIIAEGDTVAVRILSEGTNLAPLNGMLPPTGKRFAARQSHWFRVTDGKLAEHRRVLAVDLQAHGRTADIDRPLRFELLADDIAALLGHLALEGADVMGYSLGGGVALRTAIQHPEVVRRLVLVWTPCRRDGWYPEVLAGMAQMGPQAAEPMKQTPM